MSYAVKILTPADIDAVEAALWYDSQSEGLGAEFLQEINATALRLAQNPEIYASFTRELESLHPDNRHVKDKIRQQLQVLRDMGLLIHLERGHWRLP